MHCDHIEARSNVGNEKLEIKQYTRAIVDNMKKTNLCYKCGEKWTPKHRDVCKMRNNGSTKLNMIIELSDDEELVDSTVVLDASQDETTGTIDSDEAPDSGVTKGTNFPFDPGGAMLTTVYD